jgi:LysR family transcriptional regulator, transcriptional activator of the cysJI operon
MLDYKTEIFIRTAALLNISQAARELNVSQPAVTAAIQKLEEQYGVKLFLRHPRGLELTQAGAKLYQRLKELKDRSVQVENEMMQIQGEIHGYLRLGASPTVGDYILPRLLGQFCKLYPDIRYSLQIGNNQQVYKQLKEGNIELAFLAGNLPGKSLNALRVFEDEMILIVSSRHPWRSCLVIEKEELVNQPLILRERGSASRKDMEKAFDEIGLAQEKLFIVAEFYSLEAIKTAVESDLGIALISRWAILKEQKLKCLHAVKIKGVNLVRGIHAVTLNENRLTEAASRFLKFSAMTMERNDL